MSKLSRSDIVKELIDNHLNQDPEVVDYVVRQLAEELDRIKLNLFGWTREQLEENKAWAIKKWGSRFSSPRGILEEYFEMKGDRWLRELHKRDCKQQRDLV